MPPSFAALRYIYSGPHYDVNSRLDSRIRFSFFWGWGASGTEKEGEAIWIVFPYGAAEDEVEVLYLNPKTSKEY